MKASIDIPDLLITIDVLVDDWYQVQGQALLRGKPGAKPEFSDSEMITLMLAQDLIPYPGETQFVAFMRANYGALFPRLIDQGQFNRRARSLRWLVEHLRQVWGMRLGVVNPKRLLAKTVHGLSTRVIVKVTSLVLKILLRCCFAIDVQSFQVLSNSH